MDNRHQPDKRSGRWFCNGEGLREWLGLHEIFKVSRQHEKNSAVNYRSMDIIEVNTSAISGKSIQMDHMMTGCESEVTYEAEPLFWNLITIKTLGMETFRIDRSNQYTYF